MDLHESPPENLYKPPSITPLRELPPEACPSMRKGCGGPKVPHHTPPVSPGIRTSTRRNKGEVYHPLSKNEPLQDIQIGTKMWE